MASSYSQDFRKKVMSYVNKGNSYKKTAEKFDISHNTVRNWDKRYKTEGHYCSRKVGGKKGRVRAEDVASYIEENPDFILSDMGNHFNMSAPGAHYWLKKLGYSYKKKISPMWRQMKRREKSTQKI